MSLQYTLRSLFFFNDTATTEIYTLSLHDALPISAQRRPDFTALQPGVDPQSQRQVVDRERRPVLHLSPTAPDRKSTRLNSSHANISYAVFCLKKKKNRCTTHSHI